MLNTLDYNSYIEFVNTSKFVGIDKKTPSYTAFCGRIATDYLKDLGAHKTGILLFLASRTLQHGRAHAGIYVNEFVDGIDISLPTLRRCIRELCEDGQIDITTCVNGMERKDKLPRMYRINGNQFPNKGRATMGILRESKRDKEQAQVIENGDEGRGQKVVPVVKNLKVLNTKTQTLSTAPRRDVSEVVAEVRARSTARAEKVAARTANQPARLSIHSIQAKLDEYHALYSPATPRLIATVKTFGVFRRRHTERPVEVDAFLSWAIMYWAQTASRSIAAADRARAEGQRTFSPMSRAPNFEDLAYRYSYFVKVFGSFRAERQVGLVDEKDEQIAKLKAVTRNVMQENAALRQRVRTRVNRVAPVSVDKVQSARASWEDDDERQVG